MTEEEVQGGDDKIKKVYQTLSQGGNNLGTEDQFRSAMMDETKRKKIYEALSTANNLGSYEQFSSLIPKQSPAQTMKVPNTPMTQGAAAQGMPGVGELIPSQIPTTPEASTSQLGGSTSGLETSPLGTTTPKTPMVGLTFKEAVKQGYTPSSPEELIAAEKAYKEGPTIVTETKVEEESSIFRKMFQDAKAEKEREERDLAERTSSAEIDPTTNETIYVETPTFKSNRANKLKYGWLNIENKGEKYIEAPSSNTYDGFSTFNSRAGADVYLPLSRGIDFWHDVKNQSIEAIPEEIRKMGEPGIKKYKEGLAKEGLSVEDKASFGVLSDQSRMALPQEMRKVLADYESNLKKFDQEKYNSMQSISKYAGKKIPFNEVYGFDNERSLDWYVNDEFKDLKMLINESPEESKKRGYVIIGQPTKDMQINFVNDALNHQAKLITADFNARTKNGTENPKYEDGTTAVDRYKDALSEMTRISNEILNNSDLSENIKKSEAMLKKAEDEQKMADAKYEQYYKENPIQASIYYNLSDPLLRSVTSIPRKFFSIPSIVGIDLPEFEAKVKQGKEMEQAIVGNRPTELQKSIFERPLNIIPQATEMIADIYLIGKTGGVMESAGLATRPAFFASTVMNTYSDYRESTYDQLIKAGVPEAKAKEAADANALMGSLFTGMIESVFPGMEKVIAGGVKKEASEELIKSLLKGETVSESMKKVGMNYLKEMPKEQAEEILNLLTDKMSNAKTNYDLGHQYLDADVNAREIGETMVMTGVVSGFAEMKQFKTPNGLQRAALFDALSNEENFNKSLQNMLDKGLIKEDEVNKLQEDISDLKTVIGGLPESVKLDTQKGMDLVMNLYKKKKIKEEDKGTYVDDKFAPEKERITNERLAKIDSEIDEIVKVPEVPAEGEKKEGKTRDTSFVNDTTGETGIKSKKLSEMTPEELIPNTTSFKDIKAEDMVSTSTVFKNKPSDDYDMELEDRRKIVENKDKMSEQTVNIDELIPTQPLLDKRKIGEREGDAKPVLLKNEKGTFILDGHHRIASDIQAGKTEVDAIVVDGNKETPPTPKTETTKEPKITITNNEGTKEFKLDDKFYSEKEFNDVIDNPEISKGIKEGAIVVSVNNPSPEIQTKLETLKIKPDVQEQTKTEAGEEADVLTKVESIKTEQNAETIRSNEGQVPEGRALEEVSAGQGGENLQRKPSEITSDEKKQVEEISPAPKTEAGETIPPEESEQSKEKPSDEEKQRKFAGQVINDKNVREEVKTAMKEKNYEVIPNDVTIAEAEELLKDNPIEEIESAVLDMNNNMPFRVRAVVGMQTIRKLNDQGFKAKSEEEKKGYYDRAAKIADELAKKGTELGQGIQAFSLWSATSVDGMIRAGRRAIEDTKKVIDGDTKHTRDKIKNNYKKAVKKSANKTVKKLEEKTSSVVKTFGMSRQEIKDKKAAALEKFKKATKGGPLTSGGLNKEAIEAAGEYGYLLIADGINTFKEWSAKMKKDTGLDNESVSSIWESKVMDNKKTLAQLASASNLSEIVFKHYTEPGETTLAERVQKELGIDEDAAKKVADEIDSEYQKISKKEIEDSISNDIVKSKGRTRKAINKLKKSEEPLTDDIIKEAFYDAYGVKDLSQETIDKLQKLDKQRQAAPDGSFLKNNITIEMLSEISKMEGVSWSDVVWGIWYANVLSGPETQLLNMTSNAQNLILEYTVSGIEQGMLRKDPKAVWNNMKGLLTGLTKGLTEAQSILMEGPSQAQVESMKLESKNALEKTTFIGGPFNPANYAKYVPRFMAAIDAVGFSGAQNMMAHEIARDMAKEEGLTGAELEERTKEILGYNEEAYNDIIQQANDEVKGVYEAQNKEASGVSFNKDVRKRTNEILFQKMPIEVQEKATSFGRFVTYNYDPKGWLGAVANTIINFNRLVPPFRVVVPFVRVVANVLNQQLDYTPYGYLRALGINASSWTEKYGRGTSTRQNETTKERNREYVKATMGTTLMATIMMLAAMHDDEEDPEFDVTGKGPSDFNKKNQLYAQGWKPYSIKIGGKYISYQYSPIGYGFSLIGNYRDGEKYQELDKKSRGVKFLYAMKSSASGMFDMSFLTGLSGFLEALTSSSDPEKSVDKFLKSTIKTGTSFVIPNLFRQIDNIYVDNTVYNADDLTSYILSDIPFVRSFSGLKPKLNILGEPVHKDPSIFRRFVSNKNENRVWKLLADKRIFISGASPNTKNIDKTPMTPDQFYKYVQYSGSIAKDLLINEEAKIREMENLEAQQYVNKRVRLARKQAKLLIHRGETYQNNNLLESTNFFE